MGIIKDIAGALVQPAANLIDSAFGTDLTGRKAAKKDTQELSQYQTNLNKEMADYNNAINVQNWNMQNAYNVQQREYENWYNSPLHQKQMMLAAGINPLAGQFGQAQTEDVISPSSIASSQFQAQSLSSPYSYNNIIDSIKAGVESQKIVSEKDLNEQQKSFNEMYNRGLIEMQHVTIELSKEEVQNKRVDREKLQKDIEVANKNLELMQQNLENSRQELANMQEEQRKIIQDIANGKALTEAQVKNYAAQTGVAYANADVLRNTAKLVVGQITEQEYKNDIAEKQVLWYDKDKSAQHHQLNNQSKLDVEKIKAMRLENGRVMAGQGTAEFMRPFAEVMGAAGQLINGLTKVVK